MEMWRLKLFAVRTEERILWGLARRIPKRLAYFVFMNILGYATSGEYGNEYPLGVTAWDAIERFTKDHNIRG